MNKIWILLVVLLLISGGYFVYAFKSNQTEYAFAMKDDRITINSGNRLIKIIALNDIPAQNIDLVRKNTPPFLSEKDIPVEDYQFGDYENSEIVYDGQSNKIYFIVSAKNNTGRNDPKDMLFSYDIKADKVELVIPAQFNLFLRKDRFSPDFKYFLDGSNVFGELVGKFDGCSEVFHPRAFFDIKKRVYLEPMKVAESGREPGNEALEIKFKGWESDGYAFDVFRVSPLTLANDGSQLFMNGETKCVFEKTDKIQLQ